MMRRLAFAILAAAMVLGLFQPATADQVFSKYSTGPTPKRTPTPTPSLNGYIYYPCKSDPHGRSCSRGHSSPRPSPRPSSRPHPRPSGRPA